MKEREGFKFSIWWMNPTFIFLMVIGIVTAGAYLIPESSYVSFYRVDKFINDTNIWYIILPAICFVAGSILASLTTKGVKKQHVLVDTMINRESFIKNAIKLLFAFTLFGYIAWFAIMVKNGFSLGLFMNVLSGEPGAIYDITQNFEKVTGVTSFTNFGIPFTILAVYYQCFRNKKTFMPMLAIVVVLTLLRSIFFSERLAILEILVPALVIWVSVRHKQGKKIPLLNIFPVIGVAVLVLFFGLGEYFRSWLSYYVYVYPSFWEFIVTRFFGYYVTAMNTGTLYIQQLGFQSMPFPYFTWEWLWSFPGLGSGTYFSMFGTQPEMMLNNVLESMGNPEFNNPSGLLLPYHDYGVLGASVFWVVMGFFSGLLFTHFKQGHTFGLIMYPIWMVGILEVPRYLYFSSGRFFPCWIVLVAFTLFLHYNRKRLTSWHTVREGQS
ncbi:O-antigen polymerase [Paenibacillus sp. JX-17]|uniref:O-antigen polymerase n=1 Tax=Paenibacillus lacisoli TaxID=3064525 RepID=A0ABT9CIG6_9BACL|nr:O-antigen polymerase [Paenibacillus sp. JX-17]MDO7908394.1 O-antigen polymerase [Paenibacillus sp. JX-17]